MDASTILTIAGLALVIAVGGAQAALEIVRRSQFKKLRAAMMDGRFDEFLSRVESRLCRTALPAYTREHLKLNAYLMQGDTGQVAAQFDRMLALRLPKRERRDLVGKAFTFFADQRDRPRAEQLLEEIRTWNDGDFEAECARRLEKAGAPQRKCREPHAPQRSPRAHR